jgi:hypothetical protein
MNVPCRVKGFILDTFSHQDNFVTKLEPADNSVTKSPNSDNNVTKLKQRGRKLKHGEPTVIMRVPKSRVDFVTELNPCNNCVTKLHNNNVTKLIFLWKQKISGKEFQPRWANVHKLLIELDKIT